MHKLSMSSAAMFTCWKALTNLKLYLPENAADALQHMVVDGIKQDLVKHGMEKMSEFQT